MHVCSELAPDAFVYWIQSSISEDIINVVFPLRHPAFCVMSFV